MSVIKKRNGDNGAPREQVLSPAQRKLLLLAMTETEKYMVDKYALDRLIPFMQQQHAAFEAKERFWNTVWDALGLDKKARKRVLLMSILLVTLSTLIGPQRAAEQIIKWFGGGG